MSKVSSCSSTGFSLGRGRWKCACCSVSGNDLGKCPFVADSSENAVETVIAVSPPIGGLGRGEWQDWPDLCSRFTETAHMAENRREGEGDPGGRWRNRTQKGRWRWGVVELGICRKGSDLLRCGARDFEVLVLSSLRWWGQQITAVSQAVHWSQFPGGGGTKPWQGGGWRGDPGWGPRAEGTRKDGDKRLDVVSGGGNRHRRFRINYFE